MGLNVPRLSGIGPPALNKTGQRVTHVHPELDKLTRDVTAFNSFAELVNAAGGYRPTILPRDRQHIDLADAYDAFQAERSDARRAWRGTAYQNNPLNAARRTTEGGNNTLTVTLGGVPSGSGLASQWQRTIWAINNAARDARIADQIISSPDRTWEVDNTESEYALNAYVEDYPDFRVILHYTDWGHPRNFAIIEAHGEQACTLLRDAVAATDQ